MPRSFSRRLGASRELRATRVISRCPSQEARTPDIAPQADHAPPGAHSAPADEQGRKPQRARVSLWMLFSTFLLIGAISFGGGVVAYLREHLVRRRGWMTNDEFLAILEISETLPGLNSTNSAVLAGDRLHGPLGATVALVGMLLPGGILVFALSIAFRTLSSFPMTVFILEGVAAAATGLMMALTLQVGKKQLTVARDLVFVIATVVMTIVFHVSLVIVLFTLGPVAIWLYRPRPAATSPDPVVIPANPAEPA